MVALSDDEVALLRSILTALRSIKIRDIDKALVILAKNDKGEGRRANRLPPEAIAARLHTDGQD